MMAPLRFAELFAGAGGLSMGLERAGWACAWHAELADAPRAILSHRWPGIPLYGDVLELDGAALAATHGPIDLLTGGSPCQDLSVAGKRAGMTRGSGTRSSLFFEQMRLWDETGADLCLWENVDGARSSNHGKDFGEVLRAFVGAAVPVPSDGWRSAGVAAGPVGVAAWRVLDAQYFGVAQRRRRVFVLGTRTGRVDPAEVLSLAESVRGDSPSRGAERERVAADAQDCAPITFVLGSDPISRVGGASQPVTGRNGDPRCVLLASPLMAGGRETGPHGALDGDNLVIAFQESESGFRQGETFATLDANYGSRRHNGVLAVCLTGDVTHALTHEGHDASEDGTGRGMPIIIAALTTNHYADREAEETKIVVGTLDARQTGDGFPGSDGAMSGHVQAPHGIPRRLTPLECERLMSWPDFHTLVPDAKGKLLSDAARYKACGNGVASVHTHWIGERLALALGVRP